MRGMAFLTVVSDARTCSTGNRAPGSTGTRLGGGELKPLSGRPKTMVALALALVFLLSGCPGGGSGNSGGGGYSISDGPPVAHRATP
jgi:hypothetical protein